MGKGSYDLSEEVILMKKQIILLRGERIISFSTCQWENIIYSENALDKFNNKQKVSAILKIETDLAWEHQPVLV